MSKKINITVSGGSANFGNIIQGNSSLIKSVEQSVSGVDDAAFSDFFKEISIFQNQNPSMMESVEELKKDILLLKENSNKNRKNFLVQLSDNANFIYEKYGWAGKILRNLFDRIMQN